MAPSRAKFWICTISLAFLAGRLVAVPIMSGFSGGYLPAADDLSSGRVDLGFEVDFFGKHYSSAYVNNNGNVTFDAALASYTPFNLEKAHRSIIAPFFGDVDTRGKGSGVTEYGTGSYDGHNAFAVTWDGVGYYGYGTDRLNMFQLVLVDRSDIGAGDFDIIFNYGQIQWESGNASGGRMGLGGFTARAGYSNGDGANSYELPGSGQRGALVDGGTSSLTEGSNIGVKGRYLYEVRNGIVSLPDGGNTVALLSMAGTTLIWLRRRTRAS